LGLQVGGPHHGGVKDPPGAVGRGRGLALGRQPVVSRRVPQRGCLLEPRAGGPYGMM